MDDQCPLLKNVFISTYNAKISSKSYHELMNIRLESWAWKSNCIFFPHHNHWSWYQRVFPLFTFLILSEGKIISSKTEWLVIKAMMPAIHLQVIYTQIVVHTQTHTLTGYWNWVETRVLRNILCVCLSTCVLGVGGVGNNYVVTTCMCVCIHSWESDRHWKTSLLFWVVHGNNSGEIVNKIYSFDMY